jgi:hypothetical protein
MTLKEKFDALIPIEFGGMQDPLLSNCEKIADEYAIGFAEWCQYRCVQKEDLKNQLEIYKKGKGL